MVVSTIGGGKNDSTAYTLSLSFPIVPASAVPRSLQDGTHPVRGSFSVPRVPGAGTVRSELFIRSARSLGLQGDDRDFDAAPNPENSRAIIILDFEKGEGSFQINPSCWAGGGSCNSALPLGHGNSIGTTPIGNSVRIIGSLTNSILTLGPAIDFDLTFSASPSGIGLSGTRDLYPSLEITWEGEMIYKAAETTPLALFGPRVSLSP